MGRELLEDLVKDSTVGAVTLTELLKLRKIGFDLREEQNTHA